MMHYLLRLYTNDTVEGHVNVMATVYRARLCLTVLTAQYYFEVGARIDRSRVSLAVLCADHDPIALYCGQSRV